MEFEDRLVILAEEIVEATRDSLKQKGDTGRTQVSNAINVATTTNSLFVFQNWLRYQAAREAREEFWRVSDPRHEADIAKRINDALEEIKSKITALEEMKSKTTSLDELKSKIIGAETMKAIVRFLGYFRRALVAIEYFDQIPAASKR